MRHRENARGSVCFRLLAMTLHSEVGYSDGEGLHDNRLSGDAVQG